MDIVVQITINILIAGSIYTLVGLGFSLIYRTVKFFDLGYGVLMAVGGYTVFLLAKKMSVAPWIAIIGGMLVAGLVGYIVNKLVYEKLRKRKASNMVLLVAALGVFTAMQAIIAILFTSQFQTLSQSVSRSKVFEVFGGFITVTQVWALSAAIVVSLGVTLLLQKTKFGKAVRAIGDDEEVSSIVGIDTKKVVSYIFILGSMIGGLAGIIVGYDTGIEPTMGMALLLKGVIAAIIGGMGNIFGVVLGSFFLATIENVGVWYFSGEWKDAIAFAVLILFLLFRPGGIIRGKK